MEDYKTWAIKQLMEILKANDYLPIEVEMDGAISFDILARGNEESLILKIIYNVDTLRIDTASELQKISLNLDLVAVIIGFRSGTGDLEDNIMYFRHKVPIMTIATFKEYVKGNKPTMYSGPGGYYVHINGKKMQELRSRKGCSIGYISGKINISRRSVSLYETGNSTTLEVYNKLRNILGEDISQSIDLKDFQKESGNDFNDLWEPSEILKGIRNIMERFGMMTEFFKKLPFDALSEEHSDPIYIMGISDNNQFESKKITSIRNICNVLEKDPVLISTGSTSREVIGGCSVISLHELSQMESLDSFQKRINKIKERI
ncbi:MAG: hypothetical protein ACYCSO_09395 [Cuniculiplasma sp.]